MVFLAALPGTADEAPRGKAGRASAGKADKAPEVNPRDEYPWGYDQDSLATAGRMLREVEMAFQLNSDPVLRTIVCRIPFTNFTLKAMVLATGIPKDLITHAVQQLSEMDLVHWAYDDNGKIFIVPASEEARIMMISWANRWCSSEEACAVGM